MDRTLLTRRVVPVAVFVAVLGGLVAIGQRHGSSPGPHPLPLSARGATEGKANDGALPAMAPYGGNLVISDAVMTGLPDHGPAYRMRSSVAVDRVKALAAALGVDGEVRTDDQGWVVGTGSRVLRVNDTYGASWYLGPESGVAEGGSTGTATARPATVAPDAPVSATAGTVTAEPVPVPCPSPAPGEKVACGTPDQPPPSPPPAPTDEQARTAAAPVLDAAGLSGATVTVQPGWGTKEVVASPVVGGLPTYGVETRVSVDVHGTVTYANGYLGGTDFEATYPLLDPRAAAKRGWGGGIEPMIGGPIAPCPSPPPTGLTCAVTDRVVSKIRLGLMFAPTYGTSDAYLAPAWLLTVEGTTYETPMLALPDQYIATPPPATDDGKTQPGDSGGTAVEVVPPAAS